MRSTDPNASPRSWVRWPPFGHVLTKIWANPRRRKWVMGLGAAFVVYLLGGFFLTPAIVKWQLLKQLPRITHRVAVVKQVKCNPFSLSLTVRGLSLTETNGQPFASFGEFYANFQLSSLFRWAWTFEEIRLQDFRAELVLNADGRLNCADLFEGGKGAAQKTSAKSAIPRLLIFSLIVSNADVAFADLTHRTPFHVAYAPINIAVNRFATEPKSESPYAFAASSDGGCRLRWAGSVTAQPLASSGSLLVTGLPLPKHGPFLDDLTRAQLVDGTMKAEAKYYFALGTNGMDLVVSNLDTTVTDLKLKDPDTGETVLGLLRLALGSGILDWRARQIRLGSMLVTEPTALVRRSGDGAINWLGLAASPRTGGGAPQVTPATGLAGERPWLFTVDDCRLERGSVQIEDRAVSGPFRTTLSSVSLHVEHLTTAPNSNATLRAAAETETAETLSLAADGSINPVRAAGMLELKALELKKYEPYLTPYFRGQLVAGKTDVGVEFRTSLATQPQEVALTNALVRVSGLLIKSPDGNETAAEVPSFALEKASVNLTQKAIHIGAIRSAGTKLQARRERDGSLNLLELLPVTRDSAPAADNRSEHRASGWRLALDELELRGCGLHFEDRLTAKPGVLEVDQLALSLRDAQFPSNAPVRIECAARVNGTGSMAVRGTVWPYMPAADAEVEAAGLELPRFQPWLDAQVKIGLNSGALSARGRTRFGSPDGGGPKLSFVGELAVTNLATTDQVFFKDLVRWDELAVRGIDLELQPNKAAAAIVRLAGLKTSVIIGPDRRPTFLSILPTRSKTNAAAQPPGALAGDALPIQLDELQFENAAIHFADQSIQPACVFDLQKFSGTIKGLSSKPGTSATVDLAGQVDETSPFALRGTVNPLGRDLLLNLAFTNGNLQLSPFTPYLEKYGGHALNKGRLSLDLTYAIQQKALKAHNAVRIDQLMLGPRNASPDATKLPIKLAVALLKDNNGRIDLDLPVEGRLDDPQFRLAPIILKMIVNLLVKAATSPFKLLGALVGGGEELSYVEFQPGQAQLLQSETNKLDKLIQALEKRPAISLEIQGSVQPVKDRDALAHAVVKADIKALRQRELADIGQTPAAAGTFQVAPLDFERLLRASVAKTYGTNLAAAVRALAENAKTVTVPRPTTKDPGWFKRWMSLFKPRRERAAIAQVHLQAKADALVVKQIPELATLTAEEMEALLAAKVEVPAESLRQLMQDRAKAIQAYLLSSGKVTGERLFLVAPKLPDASSPGEARVNLSLN